ncbi:methanol dehydrogenase regulator -like protein [Lasius niger]|uniref:Methanol dehydrogenase regulator-like protein n=1 Tax=Lasius niger TaxID=67767 RepID=A0A0J7N0Z7_LASNI|nr:methanol dehydrogenase regulator -like protein [Lasius niger]
MLQCVDEQETTQSGKSTSTKEARAVADGKVMDSDADSEIGEAQATHKLYHIAVEFPKKRPESRLANRRAGAKSAAVRNVPVNEKGLRHICRIFSVLKGESRVFTAYGHLEDRPVKILFDMRGDFDVATTVAVRYNSGSKLDLEYVNDPQNIPAYLKAQKNVKIQAVNCHVAVRGSAIAIQPMLLRGEDPVVLLSRYSSEKFFLHLKNQA